jgi:hypothetical protein
MVAFAAPAALAETRPLQRELFAHGITTSGLRARRSTTFHQQSESAKYRKECCKQLRIEAEKRPNRFDQFVSVEDAQLEPEIVPPDRCGARKSVPGAGIERTRPFRDPGFKNKQARAITRARSVQHWSAAEGMSGSTV